MNSSPASRLEQTGRDYQLRDTQCGQCNYNGQCRAKVHVGCACTHREGWYCKLTARCLAAGAGCSGTSNGLAGAASSPGGAAAHDVPRAVKSSSGGANLFTCTAHPHVRVFMCAVVCVRARARMCELFFLFLFFWQARPSAA